MPQVEVEAGSTKGQHRKETERKQPGLRELEQEGGNNPSGVRHQREPEKDTWHLGDSHPEGRVEGQPTSLEPESDKEEAARPVEDPHPGAWKEHQNRDTRRERQSTPKQAARVRSLQKAQERIGTLRTGTG